MWDEAAAKFLFEIGDVVRHKAARADRLVVVGRILQQCHGGIQREYRCGSLNAGGRFVADFNEVELTKDASPAAEWAQIDSQIGLIREGMRDLGKDTAKLAKDAAGRVARKAPGGEEPGTAADGRPCDPAEGEGGKVDATP